HPTGTGLGTAIFRPPVMAFLGSIVLLFQALLLAHGGITTLGANAFSMAIAGPWAGFAVYVALRRAGVGVLPAVFALAFVADLVTYIVTSIQLALAFPAAEGGFTESLVERSEERRVGKEGGSAWSAEDDGRGEIGATKD